MSQLCYRLILSHMTQSIINNLQLRYHPHSILRQKASPFDEFELAPALYQAMLEIMYRGPGVGLAANQVGLLLRIFVMDCSDDRSTPIFLANPVILEKQGPLHKITEGCLSLPGVYQSVTRPSRILVEYHDELGSLQQKTFEGLESSCVQHEIDHLDGILFPDRVSNISDRNRLWKKYRAPSNWSL
ncbi:MAG: peptide deformylase [Gammaproteobacteria bacterium]|nr:peptide deformylase [Gammaproteobacteria bacterium]